ncbi:sialoadhesin [Bombina bombina]|uniref:sialoadhesin n=1 Tax=Bombina bombina TaxID=8345 RepID=UPI00235AEC8B|nr:sialoadhesin [Bombina bombina]
MRRKMLTLNFVLIILLCIKGGCSDWVVENPDGLLSVSGSCLLIPCSFNYPSDMQPNNGIVMIWYKNFDSEKTLVYHPNEEIDAAFKGRVEMLGDSTQKNCTLLIKNVNEQDSGNYRFRFELTGVNAWLSRKGVTVSVTDNPVTPVVVSPPDVTEGQFVTFQCSTPYFCPDSSTALAWQNYDPERFELSAHAQLDTSAVLVTQNLTRSFTWRENQKAIRCELSVGAHKAIKEVIVSVKHSPKGVTALMKPAEENIKQGTSLMMTCNVNSSNPDIRNYTWYKDEKLISNKQLVTFNSISRYDYGEYRCEAHNSIGTGSSEKLQVVVFSAKILVNPSSEVHEGQSVELTCEVPGATPQDIHYNWYKNGIWMKEGSGKTIIFNEITSSDTGYYICKVQNDKGSDTSPAITLTVLYPPRTPKLSSFLETQEGNLAIIECTVDSYPWSELKLYRNEQLIATTTTHSAPTQRLTVTSSRNSLKLKIQEVTLSDEGTYRCSAQNTIGSSSTSLLQFIVKSARVLITPSSEIEEGNKVSLTCKTTRNLNTATNYTWYHNGKWFKEESQLVFERVSSKDAGSYYCKAQNNQGHSISPPVTLHILFSPRDISVKSFVSMQKKIVGIIQCDVASDPPSQLLLYRKDTLVASSSRTIYNERYNVLPSVNSIKLEILDVLIEDEGTYICIANNTYGSATGSLDFTAKTARVTINSPSGVREGNLVNMTCVLSSASDMSTYEYTWYKDGIFYTDGHELNFPQVTSKDSGSYYCKADNNENSKSSALVYLNVEYSPRHTYLKTFLDTVEGTTAIFQCTVDSYPPAELSLYRAKELLVSRENQGLSNSRYRVFYSLNSLRLQISDVTFDDEGEYSCQSRNTIGSESESIYFKVQTARVLVNPSSEALEGDKVTLTCDMAKKTLLAEANYFWYKNSRLLPNNKDQIVVFEKIKSSDAGYYYCRAQSTQDSSISPSVSLHVSYAPREPIMSSFWEMQGGQIGIIQCSVDSDPPSWLALYRKETLVVSSDSLVPPKKRMTVSISQNALTLQIRDVLLEDEGTYLCEAKNSIGSSNSSINFTAETTRIQVTPSSSVLEGTSVDLTCVVKTNGTNQMNYIWYKNGDKYHEGTVSSLLFDKVSSDDGGSYYCTVQGEQGPKNSASITLNVLYGPRNTRIQSFQGTQNGKSAIIVCSVESNPPSEMSLYKGDDLIASSNSTVSNRRFQMHFSSGTLRLEIQDVMLIDEGTYIFTASNHIGTAKTSIDFTVDDARVLVSPSAKVQEGHSVTLTCDVLTSSHLVTGYTWYKDSRWLQEGSVGTIVYKKVSVSDAGSYACTAHSSESTKRSPAASLNVLYTPRNMALTSFLETQERHMGVIVCIVQSDPPSQLSLYKGNKPLLPSGSHDTNHHFTFLVSHNSLRLEISDITYEDQGVYTCQANSSIGTANKSIRFSVETARVAVFPSTELAEGASMNLTCEIPSKAQNKFIYTWYKNNKLMREGSEVSLLLRNVTSADIGSYHCLAQHGNRSIISSMVGINVHYAPRRPLMTSYLEMPEQKQGIILCRTDSVPESVITLYKGDVLLTSTALSLADNNQRIWVSSSHNYLRLEIRDITAEDSGRYVCTASNKLGATKSSIIFTIKDKKLIGFQIFAWAAIIVISILFFVVCTLIYIIKIKKKYIRQTDNYSLEMDTKGTQESQNGM